MKIHQTIFNGKLNFILVGLITLLTFASASVPKVRAAKCRKSNLKYLAVLLIAFVWLTAGVNLLPNGAVSGRNEFLRGELLDPTFGVNGLVTTDISGSDDEAHSVVLQPDGKIIVAGRGGRWAIARYNPDGSLDTTFDADGKVTLPLGGTISATGVFLQTDGKIVVTGTDTTGASNGRYTVARLNATGALDTTFGTGGIATTSFGTNYTHAGNAGLLQPDGKIIVAGHLIDFANTSNIEDWAAARFNADGTLDTTFGTGGRVVINLNYSDEAFGAALQTDGKILIAGLAAPNGSSGNLAIVRLDANGVLDSTFNGNGKVLSPFAASFARSIAVQPDGKIIAGGSVFSGSRDDFTAERYNANGSLDMTFGNGGRVVTVVSSGANRANNVVLQTDGKFILSGYAATTTQQFALARYNADGTLDTTFSGDGIQMTGIRFSSAIFQTVVQPDAKILSVGITTPAPGSGNTNDFALIRYDADGTGPTPTPTPTPTATPTPTPTPGGTIDTTFGGTGKVTIDFGGTAGYAAANDTVAQRDGKLIVAGYNRSTAAATGDFAIARLNLDGSLDTTFDGDGKLTTDFSGNADDAINAVALQTDGKIIAAGFTTVSSSQKTALIRYNTDGSVDTTFASSGRYLLSSYGGVNTVTVQPDGKILVGAASNGTTGARTFPAFRLNQNGTLDTTFGTSGFFTFDLIAIPTSFALQSDSKIVVGASTFDSASASYRLVVARFNADGSPDVSFNTNGRVLTTMKVESKAVVAIQTNGKIWAGGYVPTNFNQHFEAQRFNVNGTTDNSVGLIISTTIGGSAVPFYDFALQSPNSDFGNKLTVVGGIADFNLFRTTDGNAGELDATFGTGGRVATNFGSDFEYADAVTIQPDGRIAAAGLTTRATGSGTVFAVARYYSGLAFPISRAASDFDGDGRADASVFRNGTWFINPSSAPSSFDALQFGLSTDKLAPAD
ncbi:MAG: hypothetical protein ABJA66_20960, partial [Actinomycetota bacterium]